MLNDVAAEGLGFDSDFNAATFLTLSSSIEMPAMAKRKLADRILDEILRLRRPKPVVVEMDEDEDQKSRQDRVLRQAAATGAPRRQIIVEE